MDKKFFKSEKIWKEWDFIVPPLKDVLHDMKEFCLINGQEFIITDLISSEDEDAILGRVSDSHREGRAADIRVHSWPGWYQIEFEEHFEKKYHDIAAVSAKTGKANLIEIHEGTAPHVHVQLRRNLWKSKQQKT
jgi:hypothetical protein